MLHFIDEINNFDARPCVHMIMNIYNCMYCIAVNQVFLVQFLRTVFERFKSHSFGHLRIYTYFNNYNY